MILQMPAGITPDASAAYGHFALLANLNNYVLNPQAAQVTAGTNTAISAIQLTNGALLLTAGASGAFTVTLASTAAIIAQLGPTIPTNGTYAEPIFIQNLNIGQTGTITAGDASTTLSGTMTIATNTTRVFLMVVLSPTTISLTNIGSMAV